MTLPNRLVLPAMVTRLSGEDGFVNDPTFVRATRDSRAVVSGSSCSKRWRCILRRAVRCCEFRPMISSRDLSDLRARCHDAGPGKVAPQIIHFLKISRSGWRQTVDMLSLEDIDAIVDAYGSAAARARACGFDGVELHMAHAYTLSSFLSALINRKDAYGGSLENRLRLPLRVVERVRIRNRAGFPARRAFRGRRDDSKRLHDARRIAHRRSSRARGRRLHFTFGWRQIRRRTRHRRRAALSVHRLFGRPLHARKQLSGWRESLHSEIDPRRVARRGA